MKMLLDTTAETSTATMTATSTLSNCTHQEEAATSSNPPSCPPPTSRSCSLEQQLFQALREHHVRSPSVKEFNESYAFVNGVRSILLRKKKSSLSSSPIPQLELVIDVAGGHGAVAALFLILTSAREACVVDPAQVGNGGVAKAWSSFYNSSNNNSNNNQNTKDNNTESSHKTTRRRLRYRHECLRTGLPRELETALRSDREGRGSLRPNNILVVACHACQHLSEETLQIAYRYGVHCAVLPCCQTDLSPGAPWKAVAQNLKVPFPIVMDLLLAGRAQASNQTWQALSTSTMSSLSSSSSSSNAATAGTCATNYPYQVRLKVMDPKVTPQNRIIICRALTPSLFEDRHADDDDDNNKNNEKKERNQVVRSSRQTTLSAVDYAHFKLERAYQKAHQNSNHRRSGGGGGSENDTAIHRNQPELLSMTTLHPTSRTAAATTTPPASTSKTTTTKTSQKEETSETNDRVNFIANPKTYYYVMRDNNLMQKTMWVGLGFALGMVVSSLMNGTLCPMNHHRQS